MLDRVRQDGDWEAWLAFYLEGVRTTAIGAVETARRLAGMFQDDRRKIETLGRKAGSALRVYDAIRARPILSVNQIRAMTGLAFPTASSAITLLIEQNIAREFTGRRRYRLFKYDRYLKILNEGTEQA